MIYSTFSKHHSDHLQEPMFMGNNVNVARYDQSKFEIFSKILEKQLGFFWRPEEVDLSRDRSDWSKMSDQEKHIFVSNLKYQTLLDSIAARSVNTVFLPLVSQPNLETWIETHGFYETIHSRSYTHILRNLFNDPSHVFDDIVINENILKRASSISEYFDDLVFYTQLQNMHGDGTHIVDGKEHVVDSSIIKEKLYLAMVVLNILEGIRFYVSFACSFAFAERKLMEGNAKVINLIARDEALHLTATQTILNLWASGKDDPEFVEIAQRLKPKVRELVLDAVAQEKEWGRYLFKDGSMIGLNQQILEEYMEFICDQRLEAYGIQPEFNIKTHPIPWILTYQASDNVQVAPQEAEIKTYLVGAIDSDVSESDFDDFEL